MALIAMLCALTDVIAESKNEKKKIGRVSLRSRQI